MIEFILNDRLIRTSKPAGMTLLDFIRYDRNLTGTKIGCREGDCGACTVLLGSMVDGELKYQSMTSCITPLVNAQSKHVVTIEGLNMEELSPVQKAMVECGGTQCGFCTVGFVTSLAGYCLMHDAPNYTDAISAIDGNICRCTGYKSIERATARLVNELQNKDVKTPINWLVENQFIPAYFSAIPKRLSSLSKPSDNGNGRANGVPVVGGGTDLYVQKAEELVEGAVAGYFDNAQLNNMSFENGICKLGGAVTVADLMNSKEFADYFPNLRKHLKLVSSTQIRNMGTLAGNFVNASPIGDMSIYFLSLDTTLVINRWEGTTRRVKMKDFFLDYKSIDLQKGEFIHSIEFELPGTNSHFNFEKVSKRTYLDIASVNTAMQLEISENAITKAHCAAGGVAPVPKYLVQTSAFLTGKELSPGLISEAISIMNEEVAPISDVRGSESYKRLLLRQLFMAHFLELFPEKLQLEELL